MEISEISGSLADKRNIRTAKLGHLHYVTFYRIFQIFKSYIVSHTVCTVLSCAVRCSKTSTSAILYMCTD